MKKHYLIAVGAAILLASCSGQQDAAPASTDTPQQQETTLESATEMQAQRSPTISLPSNIQLPFAYSVVYEREYDVEDGKQKRVLVEFTEGDAVKIDSQIAELMSQAGYRRASPHEKDGGIRVNYKNAENKRISTLIRTGDAAKLKNPEAKGSLYIAWTP